MLITGRSSLSSRALGACKSLSRDPSVFSALSLAVVPSSRQSLTAPSARKSLLSYFLP